MNDPFKKKLTNLEGADLDVVFNAKEKAEELLLNFNNAPKSRELSLAITKLEEAMMWFTKAYVLHVDTRDSTQNN